MKLKDKHWALIAFIIVSIFILMHAKASYSSNTSLSDETLGLTIASNAWA